MHTFDRFYWSLWNLNSKVSQCQTLQEALQGLVFPGCDRDFGSDFFIFFLLLLSLFSLQSSVAHNFLSARGCSQVRALGAGQVFPPSVCKSIPPPQLYADCNDPGTPPPLILGVLLLLEGTGSAWFKSDKPKIKRRIYRRCPLGERDTARGADILEVCSVSTVVMTNI